MKRINIRTKCALALALAGMLAIGPAMAEKPTWAGGGKADRDERMDKRDNKGSARRDADERSSRDGGRPASGRRDHFEDQHRVIVREYYSEQFRGGRCPPGLAKKWNIGQPLPGNVVYYSVPQTLVVQFGQPPSGYRYVRVASDILLMAVGTRMIIDSIQDLGRI